MVYHHGLIRRHGILIRILLGVMLLWLCVGGAVVAAPSVSVTISLTRTPQPPTDFRIIQTGIDSINITWTKGLGADITIVRGNTTGYPWSVLDGIGVYSGNSTWVEVSGLNLTTTIYYYRAWSQNEYGTSMGYAQGRVGAGVEAGVDVLAIIEDYIQNLLEGPMGINSILFILGLVAFAFWKKGWIRILLSICIIIWGAFAMKYDVKVAAPLLAIGTVLFFMGILNRISESKKAREEM